MFIGVDLCSSMVSTKIYWNNYISINGLFTSLIRDKIPCVTFKDILSLFLGDGSTSNDLSMCKDGEKEETHDCDENIIMQMMMLAIYNYDNIMVNEVLKYFNFYRNYNNDYEKIDNVVGKSIFFYSEIEDSQQYNMSSEGRYFINDLICGNYEKTIYEIGIKLDMGADVIIIDYGNMYEDVCSINLNNSYEEDGLNGV